MTEERDERGCDRAKRVGESDERVGGTDGQLMLKEQRGKEGVSH